MSSLNSLLSFLPSLKEKSVLQLSFNNEVTREFLGQNVASVDVLHISACESTDNLLISNVQYIKNDILSFETTKKFDLIYVDSQLAQLDSERLVKIVEKTLHTLNIGGLLLARDLFDAKSVSPIDFISLVQSKEIDENNNQYGYDLVFAKPDTNNKMSILFNKIVLENYHGFKTLKEFMDHKQYTRNGVLRYEKIFGAGFVSTGGIETTRPFLEELNLKPGQRVLDVGCGIGGGDFYMAETYGVEVIGVDLASSMVGIAWDRSANYPNLNVKFEIGDITKNQFPNEHFDVIYSRDTILHIKDKASLFSQFKKWLKPGGKVFISDYCCGPKPWSDEYAAYVESRGYNLLTVQEYGNLFENLQFSKVVATDVTKLFVECLNFELKKFEQMKQEFVGEFSAEDFNYLIDGWNAKLVRCQDGHQRWGKFYCEL